ncbi:hypothetical protein LUZ62_045627 [Rhynchospora pubera]|uniref:Protein kinase domain-containing protein n=1 Tax=Rhynchospora pubera TaxID=906938 RepID=A0AAV8FU37_9POAL|nr:hypothetical protein LUZ62_045627 [Rhynchospora pubera]
MEKQWIRGPTIGHGSCATVYLATSATTGELFAVKSKELSQAGDLQKEQSILCSLNSPHVVSYLGFNISADATTKKSVYNLFMEYAPGGSLSDEIKGNGGWLAEDRIRSRTSEILQGLVYLHDRDVIHCDIKARNVLIGSNGCAKIADFGCAKRGYTFKKEPVRGTPIFMAPEVARGEEQGKPADIWALGCMIIEMATGGSPWEDVSDPISAMHRIGFSDEVLVMPSWLSEEAKDFLSKCLRRDWRERWSCEELLKHPFVTSSVSKQSTRDIWVSPTSNLDQVFWDSISSSEGEEEEEERKPNLSGRIKAIIGEFNGEPDWSCDDASWFTIRCNGEVFPVEEDASIVTNEEHQELLVVNERTLERSFVSESSWENERWVLRLEDDIVFCETEFISVCNLDFEHCTHELDYVLSLEHEWIEVKFNHSRGE